MNYGLWKYMDRESADTDVGTRFLLNGRIVGSRERPRLQKVRGAIARVSAMTTEDGTSIDIQKAFTFKHPLHPFTQSEAFYAIYNNGLYWYDGTMWHRVTLNSEGQPDLQDPEIFYERDIVHILGGTDGISAVYRHVSRDPAKGEGMFENAEGFFGFWFGSERIPKASDYNLIRSVACQATGRTYGLTQKVQHYIMAVFVDDRGQVGIPEKTSYQKVIYSRNDPSDTDPFYCVVGLAIERARLDRRITGIDLYGAASTAIDGLTIAETNVEHKGIHAVRPPSGDVDFESINWRFLKRIDINEPHVLLNTAMRGVVNEDDTYTGYWLRYEIATDSANVFGDDILKGNFWVRFKPMEEPDAVWQYSRIIRNIYSGNNQYESIKLEDPIIDAGVQYVAQIVGRWTTVPAGGGRATGIIRVDAFIIHSPNDHKTITIGPSGDGQVFTESHSWAVMCDMFGSMKCAHRTAMKIHEAIQLHGEHVDSQGVYRLEGSDSYYVRVIAKTPGEAGNSILMSTTCIGITVSANLTGGVDVGATPEGDAEMRFLWRHDGVESADYNELGDPISVVQPYATVEEYPVEARFATVQNRLTFRLANTTNETYENMVTWSLPDRPAVVPNRNMLMLNTRPGERAMGLGSMNNAVVAIMEKSLHVVQMTGDPVTYDRDEGRHDIDCISRRGVIWAEGVPNWLGKNGAYGFDGNAAVEITRDVLAADTAAIIKSEYDNNGSYDGICSFYNRRDKIIVWHFPNSTHTVEGIVIRFIAYDIANPGFFFLEMTTNGSTARKFKDFFVGYDGTPYGVTDDGIYELFSKDSAEPNRLFWRGGIRQSIREILMKGIAIIYKGKPALNLYVNRETMPSYSRTFAVKTSMTKKQDQAMVIGSEIQPQIATGTIAEECEIGGLEIDETEIQSI